jgi:exopolysaccharide biosynthesis polyprenyl glycosylphosphotransferase
LFGLSDVLITAIAFEAAYQTRRLLPFEHDFYFDRSVKALLLGASVLFCVAFGYWLSVYDRLDSAHPRVILRESLRQCAFGAMSILVLEYMLRLDLSRVFLLLFLIYAWTLLCLFRWKAGSLVGVIRREFGAPHHVMVVGTGDRARALGQELEQSTRFGIRLIGFLTEDGAPEQPPIQLRQSYAVRPLAQLSSLLQEQVIDEVLFAVDSQRLADLEEYFLMCDEEGVSTRISVDFFPHVNSEMYLDRLGAAPLLTFSAAPHDEIRLLFKRVIDVALACAALILLMPLMVLLALLIKLTSPGPAIFRQVRCGLNGRRFVFYKFRSMCEDAERMKHSLRHLNTKQTAFKIPDDPRLTRIGRYMRKFSVDEWPQLWNVIRGDMALVGPRPAVPEEVENYARWQRRRLRMRPGLTCLWAVSGRDHLDFEQWVKLDLEYIDNWSLTLDCKIILRTIPQVLSGKGAY